MHWPALALGFCGMELFSYCAHRWLFHGPLWAIHRTHHLPRRGALEANDLFSLSFSALATAGMIAGARLGPGSALLGASIGVTLYGVLYFALHDLATHRRLWPFEPPFGWMVALRRAHRRHHQTVTKEGQEPFGFLAPGIGPRQGQARSEGSGVDQPSPTDRQRPLRKAGTEESRNVHSWFPARLRSAGHARR